MRLTTYPLLYAETSVSGGNIIPNRTTKPLHENTDHPECMEGKEHGPYPEDLSHSYNSIPLSTFAQTTKQIQKLLIHC